VPKDFPWADEYQACWPLAEAFPVHQNGIKTDRDALFVDFSAQDLRERMRIFFGRDMGPEFVRAYSVSDSSSYDLLRRRAETHLDLARVRSFLYRPYDVRSLYYDPKLTSRPAFEVMQHMLDPNLALITTRQTRDPFGAFVSPHLAGHKSLAAYDINTVFPLYLQPTDDALGLGDVRRPNLASALVARLSGSLGLRFVDDGRGDLVTSLGPEDVLHYVYAVLHSPSYRERYREFLRIDFPRIPLTADLPRFQALCCLGRELVAVHLMESPLLDEPFATFEGAGDNTVEWVRYDEAGARVCINDSQHFANVRPDVFHFHVGGYQVLDKWLKDRKGRQLSFDDLRHYCRVVVALRETIRLMGAIDATIPGWPLQ
jgi:predicted helicase